MLPKGEFDMYTKHFVNSFVMRNRHFRWCPGVGCQNAAEMPMEAPDVFCPCGCSWCFFCEKGAHYPVQCKELKKWRELVKKNGGIKDENDAWKQQNSKPCPKCKVPIEKNQGCMHMTCRSCQAQFCWLCMIDHGGHGFCQNFESIPKDRLKNIGNDQDRKEQEQIHKFEFYAKHYKEHLRSVKLTV